MVTSRSASERAASEATARPSGPPHFSSLLSASAARNAVRTRWVAEQHFEYETTNDPDVILLSMKSTDPLVTAVLMPDHTGLRLIQARTTEEQHAFYTAGRKQSAILDAHVFSSIGADWYGLVTGALTHRLIATGEVLRADFVGLLPVSDFEDTVAGEIGLGRLSSSAKPPAEAFQARSTVLRLQHARLAALRCCDITALANLYAENAQIVSREYPGAAQVKHIGMSRVAAFYDQTLASMADTQIDVMIQIIEDWYSFVELLWQYKTSDGTVLQFRTADITVVGTDSRISFQLGYGTDPVPPVAGLE